MDKELSVNKQVSNGKLKNGSFFSLSFQIPYLLYTKLGKTDLNYLGEIGMLFGMRKHAKTTNDKKISDKLNTKLKTSAKSKFQKEIYDFHGRLLVKYL